MFTAYKPHYIYPLLSFLGAMYTNKIISYHTISYHVTAQPARPKTTAPPRHVCQQISCNIACAYGLRVDENGCTICECYFPPGYIPPAVQTTDKARTTKEKITGIFWMERCNKMHLDQLPWFASFKLHRFIPSQRGDLVKIHLAAGNANMLSFLLIA